MEEYRRLCKWEEIINVDLKDVDMMNWIEFSQNGGNRRIFF